MTETQLISALRASVRVAVGGEPRRLGAGHGRPKGSRANPPASREGMVAFESSIGYPVPRLVRRLYTAIGDGGFGPGYGLLPLTSVQREHTRFRKLYHWWPVSLIPAVEWGCGLFSCVELAIRGMPVLRYDPDLEESRARAIAGPAYIAPKLLPESTSINTWLEAWLSGTPLFDASQETGGA